MMLPTPQSRTRNHQSSYQIFIPLFLTLCSFSLLTACSGVSASPLQSTGSASTETALRTTPLSVDFGTVAVNSQPVTYALSLSNSGIVPIQVESAVVAPAGAFSIQASKFPITIAPAQIIKLNVVFAPKTPGTYSGKLVIVADGPLSQPAPQYAIGSPIPANPPSQTVVVPLSGDEGTSSGSNPITVSISPSSATLQSGQSKQFTATVAGTTNTAVTWTALHGSISSSGLYQAPSETSQIVDTVSATSVAGPTNYSSISVVVQSNGTGSTGPYSITNQEPATQQAYAGSIFTQPLPSDSESHCLTNVPCSSTSPDKAIINCTFGGNCSTGTGGSETVAGDAVIAYNPASANGGSLGSTGTYYCDSTCPIYKVISVGSGHNTAGTSPLGQYFHLPNGAQYGNSRSAGDNYLFVWDQSTDGSAGNTTVGGRRLTVYQYMPTAALKALAANTCTTTTCADNTAAAQLSFSWAEYGYPGTDTIVYREGSGTFTTIGILGQVTLIRGAEWQAGTINHAILLNANCESGLTYFPANATAGICADGLPKHIAAGSLVKIKSSFNCGAVTAAQQAVCYALQTYGGYVGDTTAAVASLQCTSFTCPGLWPSRVEGGSAYNFANVPYPLLQYLNTVDGATCNSSQVNSTPISCVVQSLNLAGLVTGNNLLIIDQCVAKRMAGQPGSC
jgi:hypothetical protein